MLLYGYRFTECFQTCRKLALALLGEVSLDLHIRYRDVVLLLGKFRLGEITEFDGMIDNTLEAWVGVQDGTSGKVAHASAGNLLQQAGCISSPKAGARRNRHIACSDAGMVDGLLANLGGDVRLKLRIHPGADDADIASRENLRLSERRKTGIQVKRFSRIGGVCVL